MTEAIVQKDLSHNPLLVGFAWAAVGLPLLWGVLNTLMKSIALFR
jgi:hypothetical protein